MPSNVLFHILIHSLTHRLIDSQTHRLTDSMTHRLIDSAEQAGVYVGGGDGDDAADGDD